MKIWSQHKEATEGVATIVEFIPHGLHEITPQEKLTNAEALAQILIHHLDKIDMLYLQAFLADHIFPTEEWAKVFAERSG